MKRLCHCAVMPGKRAQHHLVSHQQLIHHLVSHQSTIWLPLAMRTTKVRARFQNFSNDIKLINVVKMTCLIARLVCKPILQRARYEARADSLWRLSDGRSRRRAYHLPRTHTTVGGSHTACRAQSLYDTCVRTLTCKSASPKIPSCGRRKRGSLATCGESESFWTA